MTRFEHKDRTFQRASETDTTLIDQARTGDEEAFEALYKAHHDRVHAMVARCTGYEEETEDLVQVTFMKAFQGLPHFRGASTFSSWLIRIALNVCATHLRTKGTQRNRLNEVERSAPVLQTWWNPTPHEDPEKMMLRKERRELVRQGIRALPTPHREAIWLHYIKERSYHEITEELQVPMGTVKIWLYRGRHQLRGKFERWEVVSRA